MKIATQIAEALKSQSIAPHAWRTMELPKGKTERAPYSFNIGLDFGTAFSKCVLRDTRLDPSRAFLVAFPHGGESPLLVPSGIYCDRDVISTPLGGLETHSHVKLAFLKMALYATVRGKRTDPWLLDIAQHWPEDTEEELQLKVEALVVFYLGTLLRSCLNELKKWRPDIGEHPGDLLSVNMAVPVAHAQDEHVEEAFSRCLNFAWLLAKTPFESKMSIHDCMSAIRECKSNDDQDTCYIYPEVSANVQSFIKSPSGFPGLFLFVDVGAGTVDASTFIYHPHETNPKPISYFAADVMPLGSSQCEIRAVAEVARQLHERFRKCKEAADQGAKMTIELSSILQQIGKALQQELTECIRSSVAAAREKLLRPGQRSFQWKQIRILTGGGGATDPLYTGASQRAFQPWNLEPELLPLPLPADLEWPPDTESSVFFRRFAVAYGLSFDKTRLDGHRYPDEIGSPPSSEVEPPSPRYTAPSKEEV
jgi:hypothetical protein